jgi:hypothetical protein
MLLTVIGGSAASTVSAVSQEAQQVFNNMAMEMAECAAYFGVVSIAMENSNKPTEGKQRRELMEKALQRAFMITKEAGLKDETVGARYKMSIDDMSKRIDKNTSNISILMTDYNELCIEAMTDPEKRARYWFERVGVPPPQ